MKITKYGHCCLLIEESGLRILTDPGSYSSGFEAVRDLDLVLITHEHSDHFHTDSLKAVLAGNPGAKVVTNSAVGSLLGRENMAFEILEHGESRRDKDVHIEGIGKEHAVIYPTIPNVMNTGYFIADRLFYPGDALTNPERAVDILALPVAGPWVKMAEAVDYAKLLKPKIWFPVHDAVLRNPEQGGYKWPANLLEPMGLPGRFLEQGKEIDF